MALPGTQPAGSGRPADLPGLRRTRQGPVHQGAAAPRPLPRTSRPVRRRHAARRDAPGAADWLPQPRPQRIRARHRPRAQRNDHPPAGGGTVTSFVIAAVAMLIALAPAGITLARGTLADAVVGFELITSVAVMVFALLAEGFKRPSLFEFPVIVAVLLFGSGLVFVRALERWL